MGKTVSMIYASVPPWLGFTPGAMPGSAPGDSASTRQDPTSAQRQLHSCWGARPSFHTAADGRRAARQSLQTKQFLILPV